jgi:hypothetical protein
MFPFREWNTRRQKDTAAGQKLARPLPSLPLPIMGPGPTANFSANLLRTFRVRNKFSE